MNKVLAVVSLTAFLCCYGVHSAELSNLDLREQILNSGTVVFLDFLEKVKNITETIVKEDRFRKTRISVQTIVQMLSGFGKHTKNTERDRGSQGNSDASPQKTFLHMSGLAFSATITALFDRLFIPYMKIYSQSNFKNETKVEIWKEVESNYLPGAPPIYSKPMGFFGYLLAKALVRSRLVNMLEAGVGTVLEIGKIDFNQLHEEAQMVMDQVRKKAFEISTLERQKEKNDFLISLRTTSGLIVFYWDGVLKHTESPSFNAKYLDSMKRWAELTELRNTSEKYHVLLNPETRHGFLNWTKRHLGQFFDALALEYYSRGNEALGLDRFNQSNWAIGKSAVVYSLPVYEKLSEVGFEITEINRFLHKVNHITLILEGNDVSATHRQTFLEACIRGIMYLLGRDIEKEKTKSEDNQLLLPLRVIRTVFLEFWSLFLTIVQLRDVDETKLQQSVNEWNHVRSVVINELLKSEAFTRKQLEEMPKNFIQAVHRILEKLKQYTDLVDGFDEQIDPTVLTFERSMHHTNEMFHQVWDILVE
ncbi:uncharacterized protein [Pseudorasbora parva]|uniref:uncharacterized protein n=1 Tax=Pseudorasbora parva TaxID=51549 RepID=UPI00351F02C1